MKQTSERLGVKIVGGLKEVNTAWAGSSLLIDLFRKLEMDRIANKVLPTKRSSKGLNQGQMIETFILLSALGGENIDDVSISLRVMRRTIISLSLIVLMVVSFPLSNFNNIFDDLEAWNGQELSTRSSPTSRENPVPILTGPSPLNTYCIS